MIKLNAILIESIKRRSKVKNGELIKEYAIKSDVNQNVPAMIKINGKYKVKRNHLQSIINLLSFKFDHDCDN